MASRSDRPAAGITGSHQRNPRGTRAGGGQVKDNPTGDSSATFGEDTEPLSTLAQRYEYAERLTPRLLSTARRLLPPHEDPRDFVQETIARVHKSPDDLTADHFDAWLFTTLRRVIIDAHRREPTADDLLHVAYTEPQAAPDPAERVCDQAEAVWLDDEAERVLPEKRRAVARVLKTGGGVAAVARALGLSYVVAQNEVARTRKPLRDALASSRRVGVLPPLTVVRRLRGRLSRRTGRLALAVASVVGVVVAPSLLRLPLRAPMIDARSDAAPSQLPTLTPAPQPAASQVAPSDVLSLDLRVPPVPPLTSPPGADAPFSAPTPTSVPSGIPVPPYGRRPGSAAPTDYLWTCLHTMHVGTDRVGCSGISPTPR
jgi:RNA polymerase sigma factor (sigma-70 family)